MGWRQRSLEQLEHRTVISTGSSAAFGAFYRDKRVLVTGHTGFKGSWLSEWLLALGAEVTGYALDPLTDADMYVQLGLATRIAQDERGDLADLERLVQLIAEFKPAVVFHLAAQPLVRLSYESPVETFATNVMGTINVMEAVRRSGHACSMVMVTTDKCYANREWLSSYREQDAMGGHDPYSASKGAAELVIASYRSSFWSAPDSVVTVASGRAGNVIGGGDWAVDRIIPDCIRAVQAELPISVRNKTATRPWQHVLEPLSGYLWLGAVLSSPQLAGQATSEPFTGGFNFGPALASNRTVAELVIELTRHTGGSWEDHADPNALHEASKLNLAIDKAFHLLQWSPVWDFAKTVAATAAWYKNAVDEEAAVALTQEQISAYEGDAAANSIRWVSPIAEA